MKCFFFFIILGTLFQCKVTDTSKKTTAEPLPESMEVDRTSADHPLPQINPDECLLKAQVLSCDTSGGNYLYLLETKDILKKGFGFYQNLNKQDQFQAESSEKLNDTTSVIIAIEYVHSLRNGHYRINDIVE